MKDTFSLYENIIASPTQLSALRQASSFESCQQQLKTAWENENEAAADLIANLNWCNQQALNIDPIHLRGHWLPFHYQARNRHLMWCLPDGHPVEPFHDQYIERCRQRIPVNQVIKPRAPLSRLLTSVSVCPLQPAGFVFHLSRCGSTLISSCLGELAQTCILSESQLLTEVLLDFTLTESQRQRLLPLLIDFQGSVVLERNQVIVKWNAWDVHFWPLICRAFPKVPVLLVVRDPVEILASHHRLAGRHMAGDPSLAPLHMAFSTLSSSQSSVGEDLLDYRIRVLYHLLQAMLAMTMERNVKIVSYNQLTSEQIIAIGRHFNQNFVEDEFFRIQERLRFHSKEPTRHFKSDSGPKRRILSREDQNKIQLKLSPTYNKLLSLAQRHQKVAN